MSDTIELSGKTALITGAAKRLGQAIALALAREGAHLVLHYRESEKEVKTLVREVRGMGGEAWTAKADFSDPTSAGTLFKRAVAQAGAIDFLVNNASIYPTQDLRHFTVDDFHIAMNVNTLAPLILARKLAEQGREGAIVNLLDSRIVDYDRNHVPYHLSKQSLFSLTRMLAVEYAPMIRVNGVAPGLVLPPPGESPDYLEKLKTTNPLQRYGTPEGIADAAVFLLRSAFVTGQVIYVDGGRHMRGRMYG